MAWPGCSDQYGRGRVQRNVGARSYDDLADADEAGISWDWDSRNLRQQAGG
jgi:hypothetical protein